MATKMHAPVQKKAEPEVRIAETRKAPEVKRAQKAEEAVKPEKKEEANAAEDSAAVAFLKSVVHPWAAAANYAIHPGKLVEDLKAIRGQTSSKALATSGGIIFTSLAVSEVGGTLGLVAGGLAGAAVAGPVGAGVGAVVGNYAGSVLNFNLLYLPLAYGHYANAKKEEKGVERLSFVDGLNVLKDMEADLAQFYARNFVLAVPFMVNIFATTAGITAVGGAGAAVTFVGSLGIFASLAYYSAVMASNMDVVQGLAKRMGNLPEITAAEKKEGSGGAVAAS